jgi:hypothetical protein
MMFNQLYLGLEKNWSANGHKCQWSGFSLIFLSTILIQFSKHSFSSLTQFGFSKQILLSFRNFLYLPLNTPPGGNLFNISDARITLSKLSQDFSYLSRIVVANTQGVGQVIAIF